LLLDQQKRVAQALLEEESWALSQEGERLLEQLQPKAVESLWFAKALVVVAHRWEFLKQVLRLVATGLHLREPEVLVPMQMEEEASVVLQQPTAVLVEEVASKLEQPRQRELAELEALELMLL
jgi:hypothetical protein